MALQEKKIYTPNEIHELPAEHRNGYFLFVSENSSEDDALVNFYDTYPVERQYERCRGYFGCDRINASRKLIHVEKGRAIYYGAEPFDLLNELDAVSFVNNQFHNDGHFVMDNSICTVKVMQRIKEPVFYHGEYVIKVYDQFIFSINDCRYWGGFIERQSYRNDNKINIAFFDKVASKEYIFKDFHWCSSYEFKTEQDPTRVFNTAKGSFYTVKLPKNMHFGKTTVSWVKVTDDKEKCTLMTDTIENLYRAKFAKLTEIIENYNKLGMEINPKDELLKFYNILDFVDPCIKFLSDLLAQYPKYINSRLNEKLKFSFEVEATYDKKYYIAAKLADTAVDIQTNHDRTIYYVTFTGTQVEEIDLMFFNLADYQGEPHIPFNDKYREVRSYLLKHEFLTFLKLSIGSNTTIIERFANIKSGIFWKSVLGIISKNIDKIKRRKLEALHTEMITENRATVKWSSEHKLFDYISKYVSDAVFQYRATWLGSQSYDIFIPSQNIAIEYQGQQHYEPIEIFGGKDAFKKNIERDFKKRQLSSAHGINVIDWKYDVPINTASILEFLKKHAIIFDLSNVAKKIESDDKLAIEMAPIIQPTSVSKKNEADMELYIIKQYSLEGNFVANFRSYDEAVSAVSVSKQQIKNAIRGSAKTAGGYQWRRLLLSEKADNDVSPIAEVKIDSTAKPVYQISMDGNIVAEHESIKKAARTAGVDLSGVRKALSGMQKTCGGFRWSYKV